MCFHVFVSSSGTSGQRTVPSLIAPPPVTPSEYNSNWNTPERLRRVTNQPSALLRVPKPYVHALSLLGFSFQAYHPSTVQLFVSSRYGIIAAFFSMPLSILKADRLSVSSKKSKSLDNVAGVPVNGASVLARVPYGVRSYA